MAAILAGTTVIGNDVKDLINKVSDIPNTDKKINSEDLKKGK